MSSIKKNFFYNIILSVTGVVFPLITFPYIARIIEPNGVGLVTFVESICRYAILFSGLGIPIYGIREVSKLRNDVSKLSNLFNELISIHCFVTLIILIFYTISLFIIPKLYNNLSYYILGEFLIVSNVFIVEWFFQGIEEFKFITLRTIFIRILLIFFLFIIVRNVNDGIYYFLVIVLTSILNAIVNFSKATKLIKFKFCFDYYKLKSHFKPIMLIFSSLAFISFYTLLDTIILGFISNNSAVGLYSTGVRISKVPMMFIGALGTVMIPKLSNFHSNSDILVFQNLINKSINFVLTFSIPIIFLLFSLSDKIIFCFAGNGYENSQNVLKILSILTLLIGLSNVFGLQVLTPMAKDKYFTYSVIFGTFVSLSLNLILIPKFQEIGAAISCVLAELTVTITTYFFAKKYILLTIDSKVVFTNILISIPMLYIFKLPSLFLNNASFIITTTFLLSSFYYLIMQIYVLKNPLILDLIKPLIQRIWKNTTI